MRVIALRAGSPAPGTSLETRRAGLTAYSAVRGDSPVKMSRSNPAPVAAM